YQLRVRDPVGQGCLFPDGRQDLFLIDRQRRQLIRGNRHMFLNDLSRRTMLKGTASGFGYLAFAGLSTGAAEHAASTVAPKHEHFPARAKHVIFLCMKRGPSHVDTFDYKPQLTADDGKPFTQGRFNGAKLLGSPWAFAQHGQSGLWISDLYPETAKH